MKINLPTFAVKGLQTLKSNSPEILTALGVSGVLTTSYLTAKASFRAWRIIEKEQDRLDHFERSHTLDIKEKTKLVWKIYIPAGISGALTIGCVIGSSRATGRRTAAAVTAYSLTERAFSEYKEKVVEQIGKGKEQKVTDEIVQDKVTNNPPVSREVIIVGSGQVLCCELFTHRYFRSDMEALRKAQNDINMMIVNHFYVALDEFYDIIGLPHTSNSANLGWDSDKLLELKFSTVLADDGEPCLAFDYNYTKPLK